MSVVSLHGAATSSTFRNQRNNLVIAETDSGNGTVKHSADFNGWITDGFALNWTTAPTVSTFQFSYLVIKGGLWDVGNLTSPLAATNNVDYPVSVNSKIPKAMLIATSVTTTSTVNTIITPNMFSTGITDGTTHVINSVVDETAAATMDNYKIQGTGNIVRVMGNDGVISDIATLDSFSSNNFRLDWTTKGAFAQIYGWVVVAEK